MDLATIVGIVAAFLLMVAAIVIGGPLDAFFDGPSVLLVLFGSIAIMAVGYPGGHLKNAFKI
ncbi:MAG: hypothetical protein VX265_07925, partial [Myxococcota bacterium]|nr:hypothetical protein [Myxococcota bacterium]